MSGWLTYLLGNGDGDSAEDGATGNTPFSNSRLFQYFADGNTLLSKNQPFPFGPSGIFGDKYNRPPTGSGGGGTTSPPPPVPPPGPNPAARWSFPQYTQQWAFTPPTPVWYPDPPKFDKSKYPTTTTTKK